MIAEEKAKLVEEERLEREGRAAARTDIVGPSTCAEDSGMNIMPAQDANDRT